MEGWAQHKRVSLYNYVAENQFYPYVFNSCRLLILMYSIDAECDTKDSLIQHPRIGQVVVTLNNVFWGGNFIHGFYHSN